MHKEAWLRVYVGIRHPTHALYVFSPLLFLTVLCLLRRILACVVWRRFISYLHSTRLHTPLWPPLFVVCPACAA